jgi:hypothetical protein
MLSVISVSVTFSPPMFVTTTLNVNVPPGSGRVSGVAVDDLEKGSVRRRRRRRG